jgi:hypothetical protein
MRRLLRLGLDFLLFSLVIVALPFVTLARAIAGGAAKPR